MKKVAILSCLILLLLATSVLAVESGWWWNPEEDGRGYDIKFQGNSLFMKWHAYDNPTGEPMSNMQGPMTDDTHFTGPIWPFKNGRYIGWSYVPLGAPVTIGLVSIGSSDDDSRLHFGSWFFFGIQW